MQAPLRAAPTLWHPLCLTGVSLLTDPTHFPPPPRLERADVKAADCMAASFGNLALKEEAASVTISSSKRAGKGKGTWDHWQWCRTDKHTHKGSPPPIRPHTPPLSAYTYIYIYIYLFKLYKYVSNGPCYTSIILPLLLIPSWALAIDRFFYATAFLHAKTTANAPRPHSSSRV